MLRTTIGLLLGFSLASHAGAQQVRPAGYKDPGTAMVISIVAPGAGHLYAGEAKKGGVLLALGLGGLIVGTALSVGEAYQSVDDLNVERAERAWIPFALGYGTYLATWIYGIVDSRSAAERQNAKLAKPVAWLGAHHIRPVIATTHEHGTRTTQIGLQVALR
ncbi:MAG: hypothetical protein ACT4P6_13645 [Gemmatimonadaceae bacterium]